MRTAGKWKRCRREHGLRRRRGPAAIEIEPCGTRNVRHYTVECLAIVFRGIEPVVQKSAKKATALTSRDSRGFPLAHFSRTDDVEWPA